MISRTLAASSVICGPKSAPLAATLLAADPALGIIEEEGRWWIADRTNRQRFGSPTDDPQRHAEDLAYIGRHPQDDRLIVHIAGIHSIGSLGAAHYLTTHFADLFHQTGDVSFSLAIRAGNDGLTITGSELLAGPYLW